MAVAGTAGRCAIGVEAVTQWPLVMDLTGIQ